MIWPTVQRGRLGPRQSHPALTVSSPVPLSGTGRVLEAVVMTCTADIYVELVTSFKRTEELIRST